MTISKREISRKSKVSKITLTGQHATELKKGKDEWDVVDKVAKGRYETIADAFNPHLWYINRTR